MDTEKLEKVRNRLLKEKDKLAGVVAQIEESGIDDWFTDSIGELSAYDNHPADIGSETFERSKDIALRDNENLLIKDVERALQKIEKGTYGKCEVCGEAIPESRLDALPWAATCVKCQEKLDSHDIAKRPVEEYSLEAPFGRSFLDHDPNEFVGFDGEDSLQAVWRYGSSDSPQDLPGSHDFKDLNIDPHEQIGIVDPADALPANQDGSHDKTTRLRGLPFPQKNR